MIAPASVLRSFQLARSGCLRLRCTVQVCKVVAGNTVAKASDMPLNPSVTSIQISRTPPGLQIVEFLHPELGTRVLDTEPEDVAAAVGQQAQRQKLGLGTRRSRQ